MDIKLLQNEIKAAVNTLPKTDALSLKINQQLEVKVLNIKQDQQTVVLQLTQKDIPLTVKADRPLDLKPEQTLQLLVSKLSPVAEFKVINNQNNISIDGIVKNQTPDTATNLEKVLFRQVLLNTEKPIQLKDTITAAVITPQLIAAKVISVTGDKLQLQLFNQPPPETQALSYSKSATQNLLKTVDPIITISKQQLSTTSITSPTTDTAAKNTKIEPVAQNLKTGQHILLEVSKQGGKPEFKWVDQSKPILNTGQQIEAKVISSKGQQIILQLAVPKQADTVMVLKPSQLSYNTSSNETANPSLITKTPLELKQNIGQNLVLEVKKTGNHPEFKIIPAASVKLQPGQIISAKVIETNTQKVQLQLLSTNNQLVQAERGKTPPSPVTITLDKTQIKITSSPPALLQAKSSLVKGQSIQLEVIKTGVQTEFKILPSEVSVQATIQQTINHLIPRQEPAPVLLNTLLRDLTHLNKNQTVSETLKLLAKEILETLPSLKTLENPKQLKQSISQSGLFFENKLAANNKQTALELPLDFKNKLLKLHQALSFQPTEKLDSKMLDLIKEMQQKTEGTLAKLILNQLTSLPKEDSLRQVWLLDLPFLNQATGDSVNIKIDKEQQKNAQDNKENWSVDITISPGNLGTIHCKISCFDKTINTLFWSEKPSVVDKINEHLDYLKTQLEQAGIHTGHMAAQTGKPRTQDVKTITSHALFDQQV